MVPKANGTGVSRAAPHRGYALPAYSACRRLPSTRGPLRRLAREWVFACSASASRLRSWQSTESSPDAILGGCPRPYSRTPPHPEQAVLLQLPLSRAEPERVRQTRHMQGQRRGVCAV